MGKKPEDGIIIYKELGIAILSFKSTNHTQTLLSLIPHDFCADLILINSDCRVSQDAKQQIERHKLTYEITDTYISGWFGRKICYSLFRLPLDFNILKHYSVINFSECSGSGNCFLFVLNNKICISMQSYSEIFNGNGDYMRHGKRWLSWVSESIMRTKCEYIAIPDIEDQVIYIGLSLDKLNYWQNILEKRD